MGSQPESHGVQNVVRFVFIISASFMLDKNACAFVIYNKAKSTIIVSIPDVFKATISAGEEAACHWSQCSGNRYEKHKTWVTVGNSVNIITLQAGGALTVHEDNTTWNWPASTNIAPSIYLIVYVPIVDEEGKAIYESTWPYINTAGSGHRNVHFLVTADTQYFNHYGQWNVKDVPDRTLATMKSTLGYPSDMRGIVIAGDLTERANGVNWDGYYAAIDGHVRHVFDGVGNHDLVGGSVYTIFNNIRDRKRVTPTNMRGGYYNQPDYSWNWDDVHFVQLNEFPGTVGGHWLKNDLAENVGSSNNPVVLIHHYGFDGFSKQDRWWTVDQRRNYYEIIKGYRVIAIFTGHLHNPSQLLECWEDPFLSGGRIPFFISGAARQDNGDGRGFFLEVIIKQDVLTVIRRSGDNGEEKARVSIELLKHIPYPGGCDKMTVNKTPFLSSHQEIATDTIPAHLPYIELKDSDFTTTLKTTLG